ncbi:hypothetical protein ACXY7D_13820 [Sphingomonas melonis]
MSKSFNWALRACVAVALAAAAFGMWIEGVAHHEGATTVPTPGHDIPVKFHSTAIYVSSSEAKIYHTCVAVFLLCWAIGMVMSLIKKEAETPIGKQS